MKIAILNPMSIRVSLPLTIYTVLCMTPILTRLPVVIFCTDIFVCQPFPRLRALLTRRYSSFSLKFDIPESYKLGNPHTFSFFAWPKVRNKIQEKRTYHELSSPITIHYIYSSVVCVCCMTIELYRQSRNGE